MSKAKLLADAFIHLEHGATAIFITGRESTQMRTRQALLAWDLAAA